MVNNKWISVLDLYSEKYTIVREDTGRAKQGAIKKLAQEAKVSESKTREWLMNKRDGRFI